MVRVYIADVGSLSDPEVFQYYFNAMPEGRQEKIARLRNAMDRCRSLGAGLILEKVFSDLGLEEKGRKIFYTEHGKPYIKGKRKIEFSLSHAGNYAAAAFGEEALGIDIERTDRDGERIAARFFTEKERELLQRIADAEERKQEFARLWTRKESFVKAVGTGLAFGLSNVEVGAGNRAQIKKEGQFPEYYFYEYRLGAYFLTVCSPERKAAEEPERISFVNPQKEGKDGNYE